MHSFYINSSATERFLGMLIHNVTMKACDLPLSPALFVTISIIFGLSFRVWSPVLAAVQTASVLAFDPVHNRMYVTHFGSSVTVNDTNTNTAGPLIPVGQGYRGLAFDPVHNRMYVAHFGSSVTVIDTNTNTAGPLIPVGQGYRENSIRSSTQQMYAAHFFEDSVTVIDTNTNTAGPTIPVVPRLSGD